MILRPIFQSAIFAAAVASSTAADSFSAGSFDSGSNAAEARRRLRHDSSQRPVTGSWLRLHGVESPVFGSVERQRADLLALRSAGYRLMVFLRRDSESWPQGVRKDRGGQRLPSI